jgi:hypothetical protein
LFRFFILPHHSCLTLSPDVVAFPHED